MSNSGYNACDMQAVVHDLLTNYQQQGKGKLVLVLHGWGDAAAGSAALQASLAAAGYQVLAPDLPGFGATQAPATAWNLDDYAHWLAALLAKLQLGQPYAIIGHSNGGAVAVRAAALGVLQPQKLVLLAAAGIRSGQSPRRAALQVIAKTGKLVTLPLPARHRQALRRRLYSAAGSDLLVVPHMQETFKKTVKQDVQADAARLATPTLLVFGADDKAVPAQLAHRYADIMPAAQLHLLPKTGHFVHLEQPSQVAELIKEFLS